MSSLSMYRLSPPKDYREFEILLVEYAKSVYKTFAAVYGRSGQIQSGIDIVVETNPRICIQCKDYQTTHITIDKINQWISDVEKRPLPFEFARIIIALATPKDMTIQKHIYNLSDYRRKAGLFDVSILFWDDIELEIKKNLDLLRIFYPDYFYTNMLLADRSKEILQKHFSVETAIYEVNKQGNNISNVLVTEEGKLKELGTACIVKYHILNLIDLDPFIGFSLNYASEMEEFTYEIRLLLEKAISLSKWSKIYESLMSIMNKVDQYNEFLSFLCQYDYSTNMVRIPIFMDGSDKVAVQIEEYKKQIQILLNEII